MKTLRHYFISDSLDDLEFLEEQLEAAGIASAQIHVLSHDHTGVAQHHHLHELSSLMETDVIHAWEIGALIGAVGALAVLLFAHIFEMTGGPTGWIPWIFLSIVVLGFCTWEGGFVGFQQPNYHFKRFEKALDEGKHVFFVDVIPGQEADLESKVRLHPTLEVSVVERGTPSWTIASRTKLLKFMDRNLLVQSQVHRE